MSTASIINLILHYLTLCICWLTLDLRLAIQIDYSGKQIMGISISDADTKIIINNLTFKYILKFI